MGNYRLFIDDSGTREYDPDREYGMTGRSRYFVYGGLLIEERESGLLIARIRELKTLTFGTVDVEIKSNWLRIPHERQARYVDTYGVTEQSLVDFLDGYYELIRQAPLELLGVVVDKLHMQETYGTPWYAPTVAYDVMMQRAVQAVPTGSSIAVTVDKISGKTPKRNEYMRLLGAHHRSLIERGSRLRKELNFSALKEPVRFLDSQHSDLIQVADIAAYNVLRQFRDHGAAWEESAGPGTHLPMYGHFSRISKKFRQGPDGRVQGYGIVKVPLRKRVPWSVKVI